MLLLPLNPNFGVSICHRWYQRPLLLAVVVNLALVWVMYWLTLGNRVVPPSKTVSLSTVFQMPQTDKIELKLEQLFEINQAPHSASMPPPPMSVNFTMLEFDSSVSLPNINVPLDTSKPNLQRLSLTFSSQGDGVGSVMSSVMAQAKPVFQIPPQYPAKAKQHGIEGYVTLALNIDTEGRAQEIKVLKEDPVDIFTRSAKLAVTRWRFIATKESQWQRITIRYELEK